MKFDFNVSKMLSNHTVAFDYSTSIESNSQVHFWNCVVNELECLLEKGMSLTEKPFNKLALNNAVNYCKIQTEILEVTESVGSGKIQWKGSKVILGSLLYELKKLGFISNTNKEISEFVVQNITNGGELTSLLKLLSDGEEGDIRRETGAKRLKLVLE